MNPVLPLEYSGNVAPLPTIQRSGMHSHESEVCFHSLPGNLQVRQSFLNLGTDYVKLYISYFMESISLCKVKRIAYP